MSFNQVIFNKFANQPYFFKKDAYFFLENESIMSIQSNKQYLDYKNNKGYIRHCKINNQGKLYDYIVNKTFSTFEEWIADMNISHSTYFHTNHIRYGINRWDYDHEMMHKKSISLKELLYKIDPSFQYNIEEAPTNNTSSVEPTKNNFWSSFIKLIDSYDQSVVQLEDANRYAELAASVLPTVQLTDLAEHLKTKKMGTDSVMVNFNGMIMPYKQFMRI